MAIRPDKNGNLWDDGTNPPTYVGPSQQSSVVPSNPRLIAKAQADAERQARADARAEAAAARAAANAENQAANSAKANDLAERKFEFEQKRRNDAPLTAKDRADAIVEYNKAIQLRATIDDLVKKYRAGPGATSGAAGVADLLPTPSNAAFDSAANKLRGSVKAAQGFTGGEGNTMGEVKMNIGPFIPSSWEYDQTTEDKLNELYNQSDNAVQRTVALLGGVPDQYGNVTQEPASKATRLPFDAPIEQRRDDSPMAVAGNAEQQGPDKSTRWLGNAPVDQPGGFAPYGATSRTVDNPALKGVNARVNGMLKAGAGPQQISEYLQTVGIDPNEPEIAGGINRIMQFRQDNPGYKGDYSVNLDDMNEPMSGVEQFRNNAPQTRVGTFLAQAGNAGGFGIPQMLAGGEGLDYLRSVNPKSAFTGDVAGVIGSTSLLSNIARKGAEKFAPQLLERAAEGAGFIRRAGDVARTMAPDVAYGGIYGATTEGDPLTGAATAALGSGLGMGFGKVLQKGLQGVTDPAVQYLTQRGIPLSIGEALGNNSMVGRQMQRMESIPILGDMMSARRGEAKNAVFNAALGDAVAPSGQGITGMGVDALSSAQGIKDQAYKDAYTGINAPVDSQYLQDVAPFIRTGRSIYGETGPEFGSVIKDELRPLFGPNRALDGEATQQFGQTISDFASDFGARGAYGNKAATNLRGIGDATEDLVARSNPNALPKIKAANQINASLTPIENAMITAKGVPTPKQMQAAYANNTKKFGGRAAAARGDKVPDVVKYAAENAQTALLASCRLSCRLRLEARRQALKPLATAQLQQAS
jgi:hypothetical protein